MTRSSRRAMRPCGRGAVRRMTGGDPETGRNDCETGMANQLSSVSVDLELTQPARSLMGCPPANCQSIQLVGCPVAIQFAFRPCEAAGLGRGRIDDRAWGGALPCTPPR